MSDKLTKEEFWNLIVEMQCAFKEDDDSSSPLVSPCRAKHIEKVWDSVEQHAQQAKEEGKREMLKELYDKIGGVDVSHDPSGTFIDGLDAALIILEKLQSPKE